MRKFYDSLAVDTEPEHIEIPDYDRLGVITNIVFPRNDTMRVHFAYWDKDKNEVHQTYTDYKRIYTNRKYQFQKFCEAFELMQNGKIHLDKAIGAVCIVKYHPIYGNLLYPIDDTTEKIFPNATEITNKFEEFEFMNVTENLPNLIQNYWYLPNHDEADLLHNQHFGLITDLRYCSIENGDDKAIFTVTIFNGGKPKSYPYYINSLYDQHYEGLLYMLDAVENQEVIEGRIYFKPVLVWLFQSRSGKIYVKNISKMKYQSDMHRNQVIMLAKAYKKYYINRKESSLEFDES